MNRIEKIFLLSVATVALGFSAYAAGSHHACKDDVQTYCSDVKPGGGRIMSCLKDHQDKLSDGCAAALQKHMNKKAAAGNTETQPPRTGDDGVPAPTPPASENSAQ